MNSHIALEELQDSLSGMICYSIAKDDQPFQISCRGRHRTNASAHLSNSLESAAKADTGPTPVLTFAADARLTFLAYCAWSLAILCFGFLWEVAAPYTSLLQGQ